MSKINECDLSWIRQIPETWEINRIKYLFTSGKGLPITKDNLVDEGVPVINYGQIHAKENNGTNIDEDLLKYVDYSYEKKNHNSRVGKYDFVFADTSEDYDGVGNCAYKRTDDLLYAGYHTILLKTKEKDDNRFLAYLFKTDIWRKQLRELVSGVKVFTISQRTLMNASVILPPPEERLNIADYLDSVCSEIDILCEDIQSEISILNQYKQSIITETITKGIHSSEELIDSGVDWIGSIPSGWKVSKLGNVLRLRNERNSKPLEEVNLLSLYTDRGVVQHCDLEKTSGNIAQTAVGYKIVHKNDIVVNIILAWMGAMGISNYDGVTSPAYDVYEIDTTKIVPQYCHYILRTPAMAGECYRYGRGIMMMRWRTYSSEFKKIKMPLPSIKEQHQIVDYLDKKIAEVDSVVQEKKEQLETIAQYKKSIIFEYTTGKKRVVRR